MTSLPISSSRPPRRLARRLATLVATLVAAAAVAAAPAQAAASAQARPCQDGGRGGTRMQTALFEGITLTAAQQARVDSIHAAFRSERRGPRGQRARRPDSAAMAQRPQRMQAQRAALRAVLTGEQQVTFDRNVQRLDERMRERMERLRRDPVTPPRP